MLRLRSALRKMNCYSCEIAILFAIAIRNFTNSQFFAIHFTTLTSVQSMRNQNCRIRTESTMEKPEHIQIAEDAMFFMSSGVEAIIG